MRLREYLEIRDGLKSKLREATHKLTEKECYELFESEFFKLTKKQAENFVFYTNFEEDADSPTIRPVTVSKNLFDAMFETMGYNMFNVEYCWDHTTITDYIDHYYDIKDYKDALKELKIDLATSSKEDIDDAFVVYLAEYELAEHENVALELPFTDDGFVAYYFKELGEPVIHTITWTDDDGTLIDYENTIDICLDNIMTKLKVDKTELELSDEDEDDEEDYEDEDYEDDSEAAIGEFLDEKEACTAVIYAADEVKTSQFKTYLKQQGIKQTDIITLADFADLIVNYLDDRLKANSSLGFVFSEGYHLYLYIVDEVVFLNTSDNAIIDHMVPGNDAMASTIISDLADHFIPEKDKEQLTDSVLNFINKFVDTYYDASDVMDD